jgi:HlyD family secretion protein/adhesin transport system membrane fusion protein
MRRRTDVSPEEQRDTAERIVLGSRSHRYLAHSVLLDEAVAPRHIRLTIAMLCTGIAAFVLWAGFAQLDEVATSSGQIVPSGAVQVVQHADGGVIERIGVSEGERVAKGQLLVALDRVETEAELKVTEARYWALAARVARLKAQAEERWDDDAFADIPKEYGDIARDQREILESHRRAIGDQEAILRAQAAQLEADVARTREQIESVRREIGILREVAAIRTELEKDRLVTKVQALETQRALVVQEGELKRLIGQQRALQANLSESRAKLKSLGSDRRQAAHDEMGAASAELAQVGELLVKLRKRLSRAEIVSPVNGIVQDLKFRTVGGVIPPGAAVTNVVPVEDVLQAEVRISATDVGHVREGQRVRIKVLTYDFLRYGTVDGHVAGVSASSFVDDKGVPFYKAVVRLTRSHLGPSARDQPILPGMTVVCDIVTSRKTVLEYLLRPVVVAIEEGLRER